MGRMELVTGRSPGTMDEPLPAVPQVIIDLLPLSGDEIDIWAEQEHRFDHILAWTRSVTEGAVRGDRKALTEMHAVLASLYDLTFTIPRNSESSAHGSCVLRLIQAKLERGVIQHLKAITPVAELAITGPINSASVITKIKEMAESHEAFDHPYYNRTLRDEADIGDLRFYFSQEVSVDPRFDDLMAMLQIGTRETAKLELAHNYWDEMGNGHATKVHSHLFQKALTELRCDNVDAELSLEARICGNVSALLASRRENFYRGAGYFGVMEYLVPRRMEHVLHSWKRNGLSGEGIEYHQVHLSVDEVHSDGWFRNVVSPAVTANPECTKEILEGALWRLETSRWYLDMLQERTARGLDG